MIDLNFRMSRTGNVLDVANDRHSRYTDLENGAFQEMAWCLNCAAIARTMIMLTGAH
jgi:hypothetical protein